MLSVIPCDTCGGALDTVPGLGLLCANGCSFDRLGRVANPEPALAPPQRAPSSDPSGPTPTVATLRARQNTRELPDPHQQRSDLQRLQGLLGRGDVVTTDDATCRLIGLHLPRQIFPHPTNPDLTLERCLRCGAVLERSKSLGVEVVNRRYGWSSSGQLQVLGEQSA